MHIPPRTSTTTEISLTLTLCGILAYLTFYAANPVIFHDEYFYKYWINFAFSENKPDMGAYPPSGPNLLYFKIYENINIFTTDWYQAAQLFNIFFWACTAFFVSKIASLLDIDNKYKPWIIFLFLLLPATAYVEYLMPESQYLFFFISSTYFLLNGALEKKYSSLFISGILLGFLYFTKPHAIVILAIHSTFLLLTSIKDKNQLLRFPIHLFGFAFSYISIKYWLSPIEQASTLGLYEDAIPILLERLLSAFDNINSLAYSLGRLYAAHLSLPVAMLFPFIAKSLLHNRTTPKVEKCRDQQYYELYLLLISITLISFSIFFTYVAHEESRIHTRYYFFLWPLWILFAFSKSKDKRLLPAAVSVIHLLLIISTYFIIRNFSSILSISTVTDSPEYGFLFQNNALTISLCAFLFFSSTALIKYKTHLPYLIACALIFASSTFYTKKMQTGIFAGPYTGGEDAITLNSKYSRDDFNDFLVVGTSIDQISKFLFFLDGYPRIETTNNQSTDNNLKNKYNKIVILDKSIPDPNSFECELVNRYARICEKNSAKNRSIDNSTQITLPNQSSLQQ